MEIDVQRWRRLLDAHRDAVEEGPTVFDAQNAVARKQRAQAALENFKAAGVQGHASGPPLVSGHRGVEIKPGMGGHDHASVQRAHDANLREYEAQFAAADRDHKRLDERLRRASARRNALARLVESVRRFAADNGVNLPGDDAVERSVLVPRAPPDARDFAGRLQ